MASYPQYAVFNKFKFIDCQYHHAEQRNIQSRKLEKWNYKSGKNLWLKYPTNLQSMLIYGIMSTIRWVSTDIKLTTSPVVDSALPCGDTRRDFRYIAEVTEERTQRPVKNK